MQYCTQGMLNLVNPLSSGTGNDPKNALPGIQLLIAGAISTGFALLFDLAPFDTRLEDDQQNE